jgi:hypothetical protein
LAAHFYWRLSAMVVESQARVQMARLSCSLVRAARVIDRALVSARSNEGAFEKKFASRRLFIGNQLAQF